MYIVRLCKRCNIEHYDASILCQYLLYFRRPFSGYRRAHLVKHDQENGSSARGRGNQITDVAQAQGLTFSGGTADVEYLKKEQRIGDHRRHFEFMLQTSGVQGDQGAGCDITGRRPAFSGIFHDQRIAGAPQR